MLVVVARCQYELEGAAINYSFCLNDVCSVQAGGSGPSSSYTQLVNDRFQCQCWDTLLGSAQWVLLRFSKHRPQELLVPTSFHYGLEIKAVFS